MKLISLLFLISTSFAQTVWWPKGTRLETFQNGLLFKSGKTVDTTATGFELNGYLKLQSYLDSLQIATPSNPASGANRLYFKSDNLLYGLTSDGVERAIDVKLESDFLLNRSFEESYTGNEVKDWTLSNATPTLVTSNNIDGSKHVSLSLSGVLSLSQDITATQFGGSLIGYSLWVKSSITDLQLCAVAGSSVVDCATYDGSDLWRKVSVFTVAPLSGTMGLVLKTISTTSGTILVDSAEITTNPFKMQNQVVIGEWESYTPTLTGFGTPSSVQFFWRRVGENLEIKGSFISGTSTATEARLELPNGYTSSATKIDSTLELAGWYIFGATTTTHGGAVYIEPSKTYVVFSSTATFSGTSSDADAKANGNTVAVSGQKNTLYAKVPIEGWGNNSAQILTSSDTISSETIGWSFKSTAITDCGGADAIGRYNTFSYGGGGNTATICGSAPSTVPTNPDGLYLRARPFSLASNCSTDVARYVMCVGKGYKAHKINGYQSAGRGGNTLYTEYVYQSTSFGYGPRSTYNELTGLLTIDAGHSIDGAETTRQFEASSAPGTNYNHGYFHFTVAKTPAILSEIGSQTCYLKDVKASGTFGGTSVAGTQTRTLNTQEGSCSFLSLASNQITLSPGVYDIEAYAPADSIDNTTASIYSVTDAATLILGTSDYFPSGTNGKAFVFGRVTLGITKVLELRHYTANATASFGLGRRVNIGVNEIYSVVKITKVK